MNFWQNFTRQKVNARIQKYSFLFERNNRKDSCNFSDATSRAKRENRVPGFLAAKDENALGNLGRRWRSWEVGGHSQRVSIFYALILKMDFKRVRHHEASRGEDPEGGCERGPHHGRNWRSLPQTVRGGWRDGCQTVQEVRPEENRQGYWRFELLLLFFKWDFSKIPTFIMTTLLLPSLMISIYIWGGNN